MIKEFYYLEGKDQRGPFPIDQLKQIGLKANTLVWADGMESWKPVKDLPELADLIKKMPPPPPVIDSYSEISSLKQQTNFENKTIIEDSNVKFWVTVKIGLFILFLLTTVALVSYSYIDSKGSNLKKEILQKIDRIFGGKSVILDGENTHVTGINDDPIKTVKKENTDEEVWKESLKSSRQRQEEEMERFTKERPTCVPWNFSAFKKSTGGFSLKQLIKLDDESFNYETIYSDDLGYKKPGVIYYKDGSSYNSYDYNNNLNFYKQPAQECYNKAYAYFTENDNSFSIGKLIELNTFTDLRNEYYYLLNSFPKNPSFNNSKYNYYQFTTENSSHLTTAFLDYDKFRVYYTKTGKHYELTLDESAFNKDLLYAIMTSCSILIFLIIVIYISKPKFLRNLFLFGKRWQNISYENQIFFFEHSFFGPHRFTEIINENSSKGILKIIDRGKTINLSFSNKELFYKIEKIDKDNLILNSIKDGSSVSFIRMGANKIAN